MWKADDRVEKKLLALRGKYAKQLGARLFDIETSWGRIERNLHDGAAWDEFHRLSHALAGSGATFGFPGVSKAAHALEVLSGEILDRGPPSTAEPLHRVADLLVQLRKSALDPESPVEIENLQLQPSGRALRGEHLVLVVDGDRDQAQALGAEIERAGYAVRTKTRPEDILEEIARTPPAAVLLSIVFPRNRDLGLQIANRIHRAYRGGIPVIFTSTKQDFDTRLAAVRAGGAGYFVKPLHVDKIVAKLDWLIATRSLEPYRVLVVEDDRMASPRHAAILMDAGMAAERIREASELSDRLRDYEPELLVVTHDLPQCTALELAQVVRQQEAYADLPVVFVVRDQESGHAFLRMGFDEEDFLVARVDPDDLIALVTRRILRRRFIRSVLTQDNLAKSLVDACPVDAHPRGTPNPPAGICKGAPARSRSRPMALVIEDDKYVLEAIRIKLEAQGIHVLRAGGGMEGFRIAYNEAPDVIVTDYVMPEGSGDYLLSRLRDHAETRGIPVVVITGKTVGGQKDQALERDMLGRRGAVAFLTKPLNLDALVEVVQRHAQSVTA